MPVRRRVAAAAMAAVAAVAAIVAVGLLVALTPARSYAVVRRGSAGAPLTISFKDPNGTASTTVTIAADGTYRADFGIAAPDDYTATIKRSDGTTLATIPITVTEAAKTCAAPTSGTGADWGVTHAVFPRDPRFPSYVTICGRVALATTGSSSTPAGSPPSLGSPNSVTRDEPPNTADGSDGSDDGSGVPWLWIVIVIVFVGVGVIVVYLWRRSRTDAGPT